MSRVHLYRAQRVGTTDFIEGNLIEVAEDDEGNPFVAILEKENNGRYEYPYLLRNAVIDGQAIPVKPETVSEYTEVDDKNGKKIWEWNECKVLDSANAEAVGYIAKVRGCFVFVEYGTSHILKLCDLHEFSGYTIEVIADWCDAEKVVS